MSRTAGKENQGEGEDEYDNLPSRGRENLETLGGGGRAIQGDFDRRQKVPRRGETGTVDQGKAKDDLERMPRPT